MMELKTTSGFPHKSILSEILNNLKVSKNLRIDARSVGGLVCCEHANRKF